MQVNQSYAERGEVIEVSVKEPGAAFLYEFALVTTTNTRFGYVEIDDELGVPIEVMLSLLEALRTRGWYLVAEYAQVESSHYIFEFRQ